MVLLSARKKAVLVSIGVIFIVGLGFFGWQIKSGGATFDGSKIILNIGNLSPGASGTVSFQVRIQ